MIFDLIAMQQEAAPVSTWTPADLFLSGELGFWFDGSDISTMFQNDTGTTPVTASGQPVGLWKNKIAGQSGFDISQSSASARPLYVVASGKSAVRYDGVDDVLNSSSISANATTLTMAIGQKKSNNESLDTMDVYGGGGVSTSLSNRSDGLAAASVLGNTLSSSNALSLTQANTIIAYGGNGTTTTIRVNGVVSTGGSTSSVGSTARVKLVSAALNDCDISQAVFINRRLTPAEITLLETFIASKQ